jgi:hypothetical protein
LDSRLGRSLALPKTEVNQETSIPTLFITLASSTGWLLDLFLPRDLQTPPQGAKDGIEYQRRPSH